MPRLRSEQARGLLAAEQAVRKAKAELELATHRREVVRRRCRVALWAGEEIVIGGVSIRITETSTGPGFRLAEYLVQHGEVTAQMRPFVSAPTEYERWSVKRAPMPA